MGLEAVCEATYQDRHSRGKAHLDKDELTFRGDFNLTISLEDIRSVQAERGLLQVGTDAGAASFDLGKAAEKWYLKIRYPRSLIDKLGVKPGQQVSVLNVDDREFRRHLEVRTSDIHDGRPHMDSDWIFYGVERIEDLGALPRLEGFIKSTGSIWVIWRKGQKHLNQTHVMQASKAAGLVDVKVVSFSETHSGLKLMIPKARR